MVLISIHHSIQNPKTLSLDVEWCDNEINNFFDALNDDVFEDVEKMSARKPISLM
jgi:hypothetical protein